MREFDAFLTTVLYVGEPDHVRVGRALRIMALEFARRVNAGELQCGNSLGNVGIDLPAQVDERSIVVGKPPLQLTDVYLQKARECVQLFRPGVDVFWNRPHRARRNR